MKLQDYIKYYIGCEVIVDGKERAKLIGGSFVPNSCNQIYYDLQTEEMKVDDIDFAMPYNDDADDPEPRVKLILRRLEDMTEEEAKYIINNYSFRSVDMPMNEKKFAIEIAKRLVNQMPVAHYLLRQGFDLFGLIDAGLAVDIKTI